MCRFDVASVRAVIAAPSVSSTTPAHDLLAYFELS